MTAMADSKPALRQSVSIPSRIVRRVQAMARRDKTSTSRVIVELIETGLEAKDRERREFLDLADRLSRSTDPAEQARLKRELARRTFGD